MTTRVKPRSFYLRASQRSASLSRGNPALLQDRLSSGFLTSRHVPGKCVHIKSIKVSSSTVGPNQVRVIMDNLVNSAFFALIQSRLPLKSLYLRRLEMTNPFPKKPQGQFLRFAYGFEHHMFLDKIYRRVRHRWTEGREGGKKRLRHIILAPPLHFVND